MQLNRRATDGGGNSSSSPATQASSNPASSAAGPTATPSLSSMSPAVSEGPSDSWRRQYDAFAHSGLLLLSVPRLSAGPSLRAWFSSHPSALLLDRACWPTLKC